MHEHRRTLFRAFVDALAFSAEEICPACTIEPLPSRWLQILLSDELLEPVDPADPCSPSSDLPQEYAQREVPQGTEAWRLSLASAGARYFVVAPVASLSLSSGEGADALMAVVRLRSRLQEHERTDVYLVLVSPPGMNDKDGWEKAATQAELNEAFCRIFVWLPSSSAENWATEAKALSRRLFLVHLSIALGGRSDDAGSEIAPLSSLFNALPLKPSARAIWEKTLLHENFNDRTDGNKAIAERLIEATEKDLHE